MRLQKLRQTLAAENLDAILVTGAENRRYLSGFTGSAGHLLISPGRAVLATDFRYYEQVAHQAPDYELAQVKTTFAQLLPELQESLGIGRLGFESQQVTVAELESMSQAVEGVEWVPLKDTVEDIRAVASSTKDASANMREISDELNQLVRSYNH